MSELEKILAEPDDPRSSVEIAMDLLDDSDRTAFEAALRSSQYPSSQLQVALATVGAIRDAGKVPTVAAIDSFRRSRGWK